MKACRELTLLAAILALSILACQFGGLIPGTGERVRGSGNVVTETREVNEITAVELATLGNLIIEIGDPESLRIEAEDNLMVYFETEERSGKLVIGTPADIRLDPTEPVNYYLTVIGLERLTISSSGYIKAPDLTADRFSITINSSGDLEMGLLNADSLEVDINSSGDLIIAGGEVKTQDITISSSGSYTAPELACDEADVRISSSGSATIWVRDALKVNLNSSGDVRYRGNPTVNAITNSSGKVIQIDE